MKLHLTQPLQDWLQTPYFDGWDTTKAGYRCKCPECAAELVVDFATVHAGAWRWKSTFSAEEIAVLAETFALPQGRAPQPWPSLSRIACPKCKAEYIFYAALDEYRNSAYRLTARALARCEASQETPDN